jgi:molybdate transport system substrate-binding protein
MFSVSLSSFSADLSVASASDLARAQADLGTAFEAATGHKVRWINGSSGLLARQIRHGAPYDVFLSADQNFALDLEKEGHAVAGSVRAYAIGRLGLYSKGARLSTTLDLTRPAVRYVSIANPAHAPYGSAALEFLKNIGLHEQIAGKLVYAENVQQAFQMAATGNSDACVVAWSLVFDKGGIVLDSSKHAPITQAAAIPRGTEQPGAARQFLDFLTAAKGQAILTRFGFAIPRR